MNQSGKRQVVVAISKKTAGQWVQVAEHESEGVAKARQLVTEGATIRADEASHWDRLAAHFPIKRINHQKAYSLNGACTNQAESFFSRIRRAETGIHHHIAGPYLQSYATEMAWREDNRRQSNGNQFSMLVSAVTVAPKSSKWCGYWQR